MLCQVSGPLPAGGAAPARSALVSARRVAAFVRRTVGLPMCLTVAACGDPGAMAPAEPPVIMDGPQARVVPVGTTWTFSVSARGESVGYQWRRGGAPVPGATASTWAFRPTSLGEGGMVDVVVSNTAGSAVSDAVQVRVVTAEGPWTRDLLIAVGAGPEGWGPFSTFVARAGVPSLARLPGGRLVAVFQWFPYEDPDAFDRVAVAFSDDGGRTWTPPRPVVVQGLPQGYQRPFDPTVTVTPSGEVRLYFTSSPPTGGSPNPSNGFYSALSTDGMAYTFEPGARFFPGRSTVDCAVLRWNGRWHLVSPVGAPQEGAYHAVSDDGLAFERLPDIPGSAAVTWIGNLVAVGDALRFYGSSPQGVWHASTADGATWSAPASLPGVRGGDPAVVEVEPGRWLLVVTG